MNNVRGMPALSLFWASGETKLRHRATTVVSGWWQMVGCSGVLQSDAKIPVHEPFGCTVLFDRANGQQG
jgi:hypothetical protein